VVSIVVGHPLVSLEVNNQVVEASLRQRLVLLETNPDNNQSFLITINALRDNYKRLYMALAFFNYWLTSYNQWTIVLPFMLVSTRVFAKDPDNRISLGELQSITHAFGEVFAAFATVTENWDRVNDFRATMRRLRHFEATLTISPRSCCASSTDGVEVEMRLADAAAVVTVVEDEQVTVERLEEVDRTKIC
jgi:putative ATP-binding cassette transporter